MPSKRILCGITLAAAALFVSGCAVGPDFRKPDAPAANSYTKEPIANIYGKDAQAFVKDMDVPGQWWTLFQSEQLNALIEKALKSNPNIQAAQAGLRAAQENVKAQQGLFYPSVAGNYSATRQHIAPSVAATDPLPSGQLLFSLYNAQVGVSYAPDVFGLNRRTVESLQAQAEIQRSQLLATYLTLTSNVVTAAIQEASLRAQINAVHKIIDIETQMLHMLRNQFAKGSASRLDVAAQESQLAQARAMLPPIENQLAVQRDLLTALAGNYSEDEIAERFELSGLALPSELPLSLPSRLVEQRPDVRAAEEQLHSASASVGIAVANRLPQFAINGLGGYTGTSFAHMFNPADRFWSMAEGVTQPIFDGGNLLHKERAARAAYEQAKAQYRSAVITAFQNVADTLHALQFDADALKAANAAEHAAGTTLELTRRQLQSGSATYLAALSAEQTYQQARISLIQAQASRYADTAALFQALGGGWWNRPDREANETQSSGIRSEGADEPALSASHDEND